MLFRSAQSVTALMVAAWVGAQSGTTVEVTVPTAIGRYQVERLLGTGAFASVWLAYDEALDARVAIKVLADNWVHDLDVRNRFVEEARILWKADSDRLIRVFSVDQLPDGRPYFVMAYADRGSLLDRMASEIRHSPAEVVSIGTSLCECLAVLHDLGFVHRDLKPSNILFRSIAAHHGGDANSPTEQIVLADLGLAKALTNASGYTVTTGTPAYMAPEQAQPAAGIDGRADLYSLAVILYELLAGKHPDSANPASLSSQRVDISPALDHAILTNLSREREQRDASARDFGASLRRDMDESPSPDTSSRLASVHRKTKPPSKGLRVLGVLALMLAALAGWGTWIRHPSYVNVTDRTGKLSVDVPYNWSDRAGNGWDISLPGATANQRGDAISASPSLDRWASDESTPGVFVGSADELVNGDMTSLFLPAQHADCKSSTAVTPATPGRTAMRWSDCANAFAYVEAIVKDTTTQTLLYVQIKEGGPSDSAATTRILATVKRSKK